jgi:hypothetical protein
VAKGDRGLQRAVQESPTARATRAATALHRKMASALTRRVRDCGRMCHWARECRRPTQGQAHLVQEDDNELTLLMAQVALNNARVPS